MRVNRSSLGVSLAVILSLGLAIGCEDDNNNNGGASGSGGTGTGGIAGTGGSGGSGGSGFGGSGGLGGTSGTGGTGGSGVMTGDGGTSDGSMTGDGGIADGSMTGDGGGDAGTMPLSEPISAGIMLEANHGEVAAGELAVTRAQSAAVRSFAQQMITDHNAANMRLLMLTQSLGITPADSAQRRMLAMMAQTVMNQLWMVTGAAFDTAYVQSQVQAHQQVLMLLDTSLIPGAQNAQMKAELMATRMTVAMHLAVAMSLASPDGGAGTDGASGGADGGADMAVGSGD
jgi:putative membrane protein